MTDPADTRARGEERAAQEWLLYREQNADLRNQLQAAVELLGECHAGVDVNELLAARVERNRKG